MRDPSVPLPAVPQASAREVALERENATLRREVADLRRDVQALQRANADLRRENENLRRDNENLRRDNAAFQEVVGRLLAVLDLSRLGEADSPQPRPDQHQGPDR